MKVCGQNVILSIHGREITFSEEELIAIVEKHFSNEANKHVGTVGVVKPPRERKWFKVNPLEINQSLFQEERTDARQEKTRQQILQAFVEVKRNPERYGKPFKVMRAQKTWIYKTLRELREFAKEVGDRNADLVEQSLKWAQRICNGESWEAICNFPDNANWFRLVTGENGESVLIGGARSCDCQDSASFIFHLECDDNNPLDNTVPLVLSYED